MFILVKILLLYLVYSTGLSFTRYVLRIPLFRKDLLLMDNIEKQCIISAKNNKMYCDKDAKLFMDENELISDKKLITISPGGFKGFYILGILTYIKENYNTDDLIYSGASAGSWNGLFMCYKGDPLEFVYKLLDNNIMKAKSITELEYFVKYKLLTSYKDEDFDLTKLFVGVTTLKNFELIINIFSEFQSLEDAINCCIASSHIPLITGSLTNKYNDMYTFDGGFGNYPYLNKSRLLHVSPSMWNDMKPQNKILKGINTLKKFSEFFSVSKNNLLELFDDGYSDAKKHKDYLDKIFIVKNEYQKENNSSSNAII